MNCPICDGSRMREVEKDGILIDVCPTCKGVWLDRGELEKLVSEARDDRDDWDERDGGRYYEKRDERYDSRGYDNRQVDPRHDDDRKYQGQPPYRKKKRSVMDVFGDLFD